MNDLRPIHMSFSLSSKFERFALTLNSLNWDCQKGSAMSISRRWSWLSRFFSSFIRFMMALIRIPSGIFVGPGFPSLVKAGLLGIL